MCNDRIGPNYRIGPIFYIFSSFLLSFSSLRFRSYIPKRKKLVTSTDGQSTIVAPRTFGKSRIKLVGAVISCLFIFIILIHLEKKNLCH